MLHTPTVQAYACHNLLYILFKVSLVIEFILWGGQNIQMQKVNYCIRQNFFIQALLDQCTVEADLSKKSCSGPKITTAWKSILKGPKSRYIEILQNWACTFQKNNSFLMQQLKVLVASSVKTVLWNAWFSRILIYGYFEPI